MFSMKYFLKTPGEVADSLAARLKELRLMKKWKRATLATRSGVTEASLKRFEQSGKISLDHFLKLISALGRLDEAGELLNPPAAQPIKDLESMQKILQKRGSI
jgi:HTH-type transcriptional regulator/antitoxin HipB